jgi:membrane-anchored protein YejM (alkaline phosphatase superfamily)
LPNKYDDVFNEGEIAIHKLISYSDFSLKKFFDEIKNEKWFNNTIFVITSDHTSPKSVDKNYKNKIGRYSIPMLFYTPDKTLNGQSNVITQHIDIMPSILDALGYKKPYFSFGESVFQKESWAIHKNNKRYCLITEKGILNNVEENYSTFSDWNLKNRIENNKDNIKFLKSFKQHYSKSMIYNQIKLKHEL